MNEDIVLGSTGVGVTSVDDTDELADKEAESLDDDSV